MVARQARGLARMEQILDAAASVVAEHGDAGLTMSGVAREAGISPGSLYQFYPGKPELLAALADRYVESLGRGLPPVVDTAAVRSAPLDELLDRTLDPLLEFTIGNPGFRALFARLETESLDVPSLATLRDLVLQRLLGLFAIRAPGLADTRARRVATVAVQLVKGMLPALAEAGEAERAALIGELKTALIRYLGPYDEVG